MISDYDDDDEYDFDDSEYLDDFENTSISSDTPQVSHVLFVIIYLFIYLFN